MFERDEDINRTASGASGSLFETASASSKRSGWGRSYGAAVASVSRVIAHCFSGEGAIAIAISAGEL